MAPAEITRSRCGGQGQGGDAGRRAWTSAAPGTFPVQSAVPTPASAVSQSGHQRVPRPPGPHLSPSLPVSHRRLGTARHVSEILTNGRAGRPSCRKAIRSIGRGCVSSIFLQYTTHSLLALSLGQENLLRCTCLLPSALVWPWIGFACARVPAIRACGWRESLVWPRFKEGVRAYPLLHLEHAV